jgi:inosine-uridine nucleoside N-ribohydrolase
MMPLAPIPQIILDTDPGGDDVFAFLWLLSLMQQGFAEVVAVTATDGNVAASQTFRNASQILRLMKCEQVEVGRGVLLKEPASEDAAHIHGSDGMGNLSQTLPEHTHDYASARFSDEIIIDRLNAKPGEITLVAIGPLTNLATAEEKSPGILQKAKEIVIMGGAILHPGNVTPHAEFNIWFNPEAAATVFNRRDDIVMLPLDVTRRLIFTQTMARSISEVAPENEIGRFLFRLCEFMTGTALSYRETRGVSGFLVHDAATLGYLFYPEMFSLQRAKVQIETKGDWTRGQTVIDRRSFPKLSTNAWVAMQVDETRFFTSLIEDLKFLLK